MPKDEELTNELAIELYFHCALCMKELNELKDESKFMSPRDYAQVEAGWTVKGFQVWCKRHDCNIVHIDFQGQKHYANTSRKEITSH